MSGQRSLLRCRFSAQLLAGPPAGDPVEVTERLLAIQAQDPRGARLAIRARSGGLSAADIDRALSDRSLLITWLNRGTLHLVRSEDYPMLQALTTPQLLGANATRLAQEGVSPDHAERALAVVSRALAQDGPLPRAELRARIARSGLPTGGQAFVHLMVLASLRGLVVRGPMVAAEHAYVLVRDWLGESRPPDRDRALAELARRYLVGHGPASERDLAKWTGLALRDTRAGLSAIASELRSRGDGLVDLARRTNAPALPPPRLLGAFDPLLHGWTSRQPILGRHEPLVVSGGIFRAFALVSGRAAAIWKLSPAGVVLHPFEELSVRADTALKRDARDVERFLERV